MNQRIKPPSRMFRTIVLMGSGIALSCGGIAREDAGSQPSSGGSAGKTSSPTAGTGDEVSDAGNLSISIGGSAGVGTSSDAGVFPPPPTACPPSQWTCADSESCTYDIGWSPTNCKCDPTRPKSAASCAAGQTFTCRRTSYASENPYGFECSCIPTTSHCACDTAYGSEPQAVYDCDTQSVPDTTLCGCAIVFLR